MGLFASRLALCTPRKGDGEVSDEAIGRARQVLSKNQRFEFTYFTYTPVICIRDDYELVRLYKLSCRYHVGADILRCAEINIGTLF
jgi:hypothetical protein